MKHIAALFCIGLAGCLYGGPLAGGKSEIREGAFPDRVGRLWHDAGGARSVNQLLPSTSQDSGAVYVLVIDDRAAGVGNAQVAVLRHTPQMPKLPKEGWQSVDGFGVFAQRLPAGEYVVFVRDSYHWPARRLIQVRSNNVDTLLAVMRSGTEPGVAGIRFP